MKRISAERAMLGMTQADLAKEMQVDPRTIRHWEEKDVVPSHAVIKLAKYFGCTTDWLFGLSESRK